MLRAGPCAKNAPASKLLVASAPYRMPMLLAERTLTGADVQTGRLLRTVASPANAPRCGGTAVRLRNTEGRHSDHELCSTER